MAYVASSVRSTNASDASEVTDSGFVLSGGTNRKVIVAMYQIDGGANGWVSAGVTFNTVAMTRLFPTAADLVITTTERRLSLWYMDEASLPAAGTYSIVGTCEIHSGSVNCLSLLAWEHSGLKAGAAADGQSHVPGVASATTNTITPTAANSDIAHVGYSAYGTAEVAAGACTLTGYTPTERFDASITGTGIDDTAFLATTDGVAAGAATAAITWDHSTTVAQIVVALSPAVSGNAGTQRGVGRGIERGIGRGIAA